jgi:hypothetical protein
MDHLTIVTAVGKSIYLKSDIPGKTRIVGSERIVTTTRTRPVHGSSKRQQLFLTLANPPAR